MVVGGFPRFLNLSPVDFSFISLIVVLHFYSLFRCRGFIHLNKELYFFIILIWTICETIFDGHRYAAVFFSFFIQYVFCVIIID